MKRRIVLLLLLVVPFAVFAQRRIQSSPISIVVGDSLYEIAPVVTQSEYKPGWKIVDFQTNGKMSRYLWGKHSRQYADDQQPCIIIYAGNYKLNDFVLIKLKEKRDYRKFPSHNLYECDFRRFDLDLVAVKILDDDKYEARFHSPLVPGEYCITNLKYDPENDFCDVVVYPFTIVK